MDFRTEYRVVFRPDAANRWIAQYRRWWSPFWGEHVRMICGGDLPLSVPIWYDTEAEARAWCHEHAHRESRRAAEKKARRRIVNMGRLP